MARRCWSACLRPTRCWRAAAHTPSTTYTRPNACQPFARRLSVVMTRPSYVNEYPSGLVNRKRRAAGGVMVVSSRYTGHGASVGQRLSSFNIFSRDIRPADEVAAILVDVRHRHRQLMANGAINADRVLVGSRRTHLGIPLQVDLRIDRDGRARIVTGGGIEADHRDRGRTRVKRLQLSGEDALKEPSVTRPQNRATVGTQLCRDTEPRRPEVPRVHRPEAGDDGVGLARLRSTAGRS